MILSRARTSFTAGGFAVTHITTGALIDGAVTARCLLGARVYNQDSCLQKFPVFLHTQRTPSYTNITTMTVTATLIAPAVTDPHSYTPPSVTDCRSPCPALNALANHGYLYVSLAYSMCSSATDEAFNITGRTTDITSPSCRPCAR